ncbi:hypothetical protein BC936DRAFT_137342 [Jimgerdemannia flammicorona]|uniref:DUF221-domain-containing protein n=1 Tax=Jimgerdemannia flammicorona TaxID=994334 RepID=A0A433CXM7_9FUNG|nr:hypothetical protein BC936DRAFT_137342 [Jimgerdemannia flammicorona]
MSEPMASIFQADYNLALSYICLASVLGESDCADFNLVYAPKYKYASPTKQPPKIGRGFLDWIKPVLTTGEDELIEKIGFDAVLFLRFLSVCRRILYFIGAVGVFILIPVNIIATKYTGDWPPRTSAVDFLSMSTINDYSGDDSNHPEEPRWYWAHVGATWLFSLVVYCFLYNSYSSYVDFRRKYFESEEYQNSMHAKTLAVMNVPQTMQSDEKLKAWFQSMGLPYPVTQASIGRKADKLPELMEKHENAVRELEGALANYLQDGKTAEKRPKASIGGFLGCGGKSVDAIDYYTKEVQELEAEIDRIREKLSTMKPTNYGWISFDRISYAHAAGKHLSTGLPIQFKAQFADQPIIKLAPSPKDIIWSNLALNQHLRNSKRLIGNLIFVGFTFFWFLPLSALSAAANLKNIVKIWPQSKDFLKSNPFITGLIESWLSPIIMAVFFFLLPKLLRFLSQQQGSITQSSLDRQVLGKLYFFFIINNLLIFTLSGSFLSTWGALQADIRDGTATPQSIWAHVYVNLNILAQKLSDVSNFWINYVSLRGLGVVLDLAQAVALVTITLRKIFTKPTPRQLRELTRPPDFDYPLFYNVMLFFFTVGLLYSVIAPLVLPFTLVYFLLSTVVFRYLLMYVYATKIETGGQIWRVVFNRLLASTILFQLVMLGVLNLKGGHWQSVALIPLPFVSFVFKMVCRSRFDSKVYYYISRDGHESIEARRDGTVKQRLSQRFGHPAFSSELATPMVHANVKHLLPEVYRTRVREVTKTVTSGLTRRMSIRQIEVINGINGGNDIKFQAVEKNELEVDDSREGLSGAYKFDEGDQLLENAASPSFDRLPPSRGDSVISSGNTYSSPSQKNSYPRPPESPYNRSYPSATPSAPGSVRGREYINPPQQYMPTPSPNRSNSDSMQTLLPQQQSFGENYFVGGRGYGQQNPNQSQADFIELANIPVGGMVATESNWAEKEEAEDYYPEQGTGAESVMYQQGEAYAVQDIRDSPHSLARSLHPGADEVYENPTLPHSENGYQGFAEQQPALIYDGPQAAVDEYVDEYGLPVSQGYPTRSMTLPASQPALEYGLPVSQGYPSRSMTLPASQPTLIYDDPQEAVDEYGLPDNPSRSMTLPASQQSQPLDSAGGLQVPTDPQGGNSNRLSDTGTGGRYDRTQYGGGYFNGNS